MRRRDLQLAIGALVLTAGAIATSPAAMAEAARTRARPTQVDGVVVDREGHGLGGAVVLARLANATPAGDPLAGGVLTDTAGHFRLVGLPPGEYVFIALRGEEIGTTPEMPVVDRLTVTIWMDEATRA
jgi:hypothetical protein